MGRESSVVERAGVMDRAGTYLGCTAGQAWTLLVGIVLAIALMIATFPPALRSGPPASPPGTPSLRSVPRTGVLPSGPSGRTGER